MKITAQGRSTYMFPDGERHSGRYRHDRSVKSAISADPTAQFATQLFVRDISVAMATTFAADRPIAAKFRVAQSNEKWQILKVNVNCYYFINYNLPVRQTNRVRQGERPSGQTSHFRRKSAHVSSGRNLRGDVIASGVLVTKYRCVNESSAVN